MSYSTKKVFDTINLKLARLRTSAGNSKNVYETREIQRAVKEIEDLRNQFKENG